MSWQKIVYELLSGVLDPELRANIASTINFLMEAMVEGAEESSVRRDLLDVVKDVLTVTRPDLPPQQINEEAKRIVDQLMLHFRLAKMQRMTMKRMSRSPFPTE